MFLVTKMNYEAERAMNQKRLRMEEPGHGVVQGNGLPLNYIGKLCSLLFYYHEPIKWTGYKLFVVILNAFSR